MLNGTHAQSNSELNGHDRSGWNGYAHADRARGDITPLRRVPHNLELEQALCGAFLLDNDAIHRVSSFLEEWHFFEPLHRQIFATAAKLVHAGKPATPVTLKTFFENAEPISPTLTVPQYLGDLAAKATSTINAENYAREIYDLATRRALILLGEEMVNHAYECSVDGSPEAQINDAQQRLLQLRHASQDALSPISLQNFFERHLEPRQFIVLGLLFLAAILMIYAWRGLGKTWFGLALAYAIASGGTFLKWTVDRPHRVLYIDGEMVAVTLRDERLKPIVAASSTKPPTDDHFRILCADLHEDGLPNLSTPEGQAAIDRVIGDAEVVIFDNVSTLFRSGRENEAESWMPVQDWILKHRREGRTVIIIHHAGKGKAQRGTSRREDVLDVVLSLRAPSDYEPSEGARFEVHFEKARGLVGNDVEPFEAKLELRDGKAVWTKRDVEDSKLADIEELKNEGRTVRQIAQELSMSKSAVQRALNRIKEGQS